MFQQIILLLLLASGSPPTECHDGLAELGARAAVERWHGWSVVTLRDLRPDDQELFRRRWGADACPGVAVGHFVSASSQAVAVLLQRGQGASRAEMVVVGVSIKNGGMQWHAASKGTAAVAASIIRTVRPDEYKEWIERHVSNRGRDAIVYEQIESGAQLLFYGGGQFKSTVLSF